MNQLLQKYTNQLRLESLLMSCCLSHLYKGNDAAIVSVTRLLYASTAYCERNSVAIAL